MSIFFTVLYMFTIIFSVFIVFEEGSINLRQIRVMQEAQLHPLVQDMANHNHHKKNIWTILNAFDLRAHAGSLQQQKANQDTGSPRNMLNSYI